MGKRVFRRCTNLSTVTFKNQSYWYLVDDEYNRELVDLSNDVENASKLKKNWLNDYLYRFDEEL